MVEQYKDRNPLEVRKLNKQFGKTPVLRSLELTVTPGAIHGLVGLNGSGKTTTLECILGMQPFNSGEVSVLGHSPDRLWQAAGAIVGIFDTPSLHPGLTVRQALEHARILCPSPVRTPEQVESLLGISRYSKYRIRQLSLGNRRRASIAQALIGNPAFVILDEPFNGLDAGGVDDVLALISQLNKEHGTAFLLSSHQLPYLERICSHMAILHRGEIAVSSAVNRLFSGKGTQLHIRCDDAVRATALLEAENSVQIRSHDLGRITLEVEDRNAAARVNSLLVGAGIAVSELVNERPTLESLFRSITEEAA